MRRLLATAAIFTATTATAGPLDFQIAEVRVELTRAEQTTFSATALVTAGKQVIWDDIKTYAMSSICPPGVTQSEPVTYKDGAHISVDGVSRDGRFVGNVSWRFWYNDGAFKDTPRPFTCVVDRVQPHTLAGEGGKVYRVGDKEFAADERGNKVTISVIALHDSPPPGRPLNVFVRER